MMRLLHFLDRGSMEHPTVAKAMVDNNKVGGFNMDSEENETEIWKAGLTTAGDFDVTTTEVSSLNCTSPLEKIHFEEPYVIGALVPLGLVCLIIILGNMMVIFAVFNTHKLRGATYLFIVSLACADLVSMLFLHLYSYYCGRIFQAFDIEYM